MKRKIILSIALVLSVVLVSLMSSDSTAKAQQQNRFRADTGIVTLGGPNQILRVTVVGALDLNDLFIRLNRQSFTQDVCNGGVCKLTVASQSTSAPILLMPGEAASFDIPNTAFGVRAVIESNRRDVRANAMIIDSVTGEVVAFQKHWEIIQGDHF